MRGLWHHPRPIFCRGGDGGGDAGAAGGFQPMGQPDAPAKGFNPGNAPGAG